MYDRPLCLVPPSLNDFLINPQCKPYGLCLISAISYISSLTLTNHNKTSENPKLGTLINPLLKVQLLTLQNIERP